MKNLILSLLMFSLTSFVQSNETAIWDWKKIDQLEAKLSKWAMDIGEKDILMMGKMQQRPEEVELIEDLFPLLLPEGYFGKSIATTCTPDFERLRKEKSLGAWEKWDKCLKPLFLIDKPKWIQKAQKDLKAQLTTP